jgi:hypothetical protein
VRTNGPLLSARVGDQDLWFRVGAGVEPTCSADPFIAAALLPSMLQGSSLDVDYPVSETLVQNLEELQDIYHCWNPELRKVAIRCRTVSSPAPVQRVGSFYSGGVDSNHSFLRHQGEITDLIVISGFDFEMDQDTFDAVVARLSPIAEAFSKTLLPIETNFFQFERACRLHRFLSHGSCLAATALLLGFRKVYVPSSHTYRELKPWGSHPLTDPLWTNGCTELAHDAAGYRRTDKLRQIAGNKQLIDNLIVCWRQPNRNCGECGKCLRTMTAFRLLGIESPAVPQLQSAALLRQIQPQDATDVEYLIDNLDLAIEKNDDEVAKALTAVIRRYEFRRDFARGVAATDRMLLWGTLRKLYRKVRPPHEPERVGFSPGRRPV